MNKRDSTAAEDRLDGWKEIARYLKRDVRTCQRWEKESGLPVYRLNYHLDKSKVFSFRSDLDTWFREKQTHSKKSAAAFLETGWGAVLILAGIIFVSAALSLVFGVFKGRPENPVRMEVRGNQLVFLDIEDRLLWHKEVDNPADLTPYYDDREGARGLEPNNFESLYMRPRRDFADIDGDGKYEVACAMAHEDPARRSVSLFDNWGRELWSRPVTLEQKYREIDIPQRFNLFQVQFCDIDGDGREEILALWKHIKRFPGIFLIFDRKGREIYRYVHTGVLQFFKTSRMGEDRTWIFLGGTNNILDGDAVLAVLDCGALEGRTGPPYDVPPELAGNSIVEKYLPLDPDPAVHAYYLRFKKNALSRLNALKYCDVVDVRADEKTIFVTTNQDGTLSQMIHYTFDRDFRLTDVHPNIKCEDRYREALASGEVKRPWEDFRDDLRSGFTFWHSGRWTAHPPAARGK